MKENPVSLLHSHTNQFGRMHPTSLILNSSHTQRMTLNQPIRLATLPRFDFLVFDISFIVPKLKGRT